jgi:hypothetical protein
MNRRQGLLSFLLLLAAMSTPPAGAPRMVESLRLVISISWLAGDQANAERRPANRNADRPPASAIVVVPPVQSHAQSTALPPSFFQRPPPVVLLAS